ncbi:hypothetical protein BC829DRAFT_400347, partial [Chytridium lagenaria]
MGCAGGVVKDFVTPLIAGAALCTVVYASWRTLSHVDVLAALLVILGACGGSVISICECPPPPIFPAFIVL